VSSDAYEAVLAVGPKKLKATADFGPAASKKKIAFVLESASGTTKTFYRRANSSGVATYTLNLRGTWTVYATFGDEISDTGTMQR
jgi:predicted alpha/beta hydrolase